MIHSLDGTLRYSPRDLVAYLEGDFAAWCDRMFAERGRAGGAGPAKLEWATPDEDEELELAARKGREHEQRWLLGLPGREPGLVEITWGDPCAAELTISAMRDAAPAIEDIAAVSPARRLSSANHGTAAIARDAPIGSPRTSTPATRPASTLTRASALRRTSPTLSARKLPEIDGFANAVGSENATSYSVVTGVVGSGATPSLCSQVGIGSSMSDVSGKIHVAPAIEP